MYSNVCRPWGIAVALAGLLGGLGLVGESVAAAAAPAGFRASGQTTQGRPVSLSVSSGLTSVLRFSISYRARCDEQPISGSVLIRRLPVESGPGGRTFRQSTPVTFALDGRRTANARATTAGRLTPKGSTGSFRLTATIVNALGQTVDTCRTGPIRFRAQRR